jgi:molybdopterin-guanine dinucleotide biosynthesis protein A
MTSKIAGVVLAGGLSSRMGRDKAQLLLADKTLLARAVDLLEQTSLEAVFVSGELSNYPNIADIYPQLGPLSGIHASVECLLSDYDAIFFIPVDMPLLSVTECTELLAQFSQYPQGVFYQASTFPLILPLNRAVRDYLAEIIAVGQKQARSMYLLLNTFNMQGISYSATQSFRFQNSNTPEEWDNCLYTYHHLQEFKDKS